ncbi:MAG: ChaN family lipoprotein [Bacteroidales bacterium]
MKKTLIFAIVSFVLLVAMKPDKPAYRLFDQKGKKADYKDLLKAASNADIVFFGELHNNPISHWLQFELTRDLHMEKKDDFVMGAEMFESDNQLVLNEYLSGKVRERNFEEEARLWNNYKTDYKPLVQYALKNNIPFIATNVPRRYAAIVNRDGFEGLETLSPEALKLIAPLPIPYDPELKGYKDMVEMMAGKGGHATTNIAKAQALKDATMAHFILQNWQPGQAFIHYNGTYHTNHFEGIVWYIQQYRPEVRMLTIATVEQDSVGALEEEYLGLADFILCVPTTMTKTY